MQIDFVVNLKHHFEDDDGRMVLIMEYCDQLDLRRFIDIHMGNAI
jgi:serine/threonine protein kinase